MTFATLWNKPEYWFRPSQILRKLRFALGSGHNFRQEVRLPWGDVLCVSARDAIGRSLLTLGVHELAVSEVLWRLVDPGDACLDLGANLGYMTSLMSARVGRSGEVLSFEPHPKVFGRLRDNTESLAHRPAIRIFNEAVGASDGFVDLFEPVDFATNEGTASVAFAKEVPIANAKHRVIIRRLDTLFSDDKRFGVMKVDVEGAEFDVFRGAERFLAEQRVRDIVWEDQHRFPSESTQLLSQHGYRVFRFVKKLPGLRLWDPFIKQGGSGLSWETTNYLATIDPVRAVKRLNGAGWRCLRGR